MYLWANTHPRCSSEITPIPNQPLERAPSTATSVTLHHVTSGQMVAPSFAGETPGPTCGSAGTQAVAEHQGDSAGDRKHLEEALWGAGQAGGEQDRQVASTTHQQAGPQSVLLCRPPRASDLSGTSFI